jgi:hypothetical protein
MDGQSNLLEMTKREVSGMKEKLPKDFSRYPPDKLKALYDRISSFEKELENRMNILRSQKKKEDAEQLYKYLDEVFNVRVLIEDRIKPPSKEDELDEGNILAGFEKTTPMSSMNSATQAMNAAIQPTLPIRPLNNLPSSIDTALNLGLPIKPSAKGAPSVAIQDFDSLSIKDIVPKQVNGKQQTFIEFRKQWLTILLQDQAPASDTDPNFAFRVVSNGVNKGWQQLPALPAGFIENYRSDLPLPPAYNTFRLFPIFFELNRLGYVSVVHLYNWERKVIGAYRSLLVQPSSADARAIRLRSEQLFPVFISHLSQNEDRIIHIDFFATPQDKVPLMVWTFSEETGVVRAILQRETFIQKSLHGIEENFFD